MSPGSPDAGEHGPWRADRQLRVLPLRTPTLPPATHTNAALVGEGELLLVEPGPSDAQEVERLVAWVEQARDAGERVLGCVLTHHHVDHVGALDAVVERLGLPIWAHEATAERLPMASHVTRRLQDGERLTLGRAEIDVLHTPGHAPGHICLDLPERGFTLVGDMVASVGSILIEPNDGDMGLYLASLRRLASLGSRALLPAHGEIVADGPALYAQYVAHRLEREAAVLGALRACDQAVSATELVPHVYLDVPPAIWPLAALSLAAHLEHLEVQGLAQRSAEEGSLDARWMARDKRA